MTGFPHDSRVVVKGSVPLFTAAEGGQFLV